MSASIALLRKNYVFIRHKKQDLSRISDSHMHAYTLVR